MKRIFYTDPKQEDTLAFGEVRKHLCEDMFDALKYPYEYEYPLIKRRKKGSKMIEITITIERYDAPIKQSKV